MDDANRDDPLATAQALTGALETLSDRLEAVTETQAEQVAYGRRNRRLIWLTIVSLVFSVLLTVGLTVTAVRLNDTNDKADRNRERQISTCVSTNEARANNKRLWDYLLKLPPTTPRTDAQVEQLAAFKAFVDQTFAPRDCTKI